MKQEKYGRCSICCRVTKLSKDHIPPKCCGNTTDTFYIQYTPDYLGKGSVKKLEHSQDGLSFMNICRQCNSDLGTRYDNHLRAFRDCILSLIEGKPYDEGFEWESVCKSIIGHFLATSSYNTSQFAQSMRRYYLNDCKKIYKAYSLLCAYYPYKNCIFSLDDYIVVNLSGEVIPEGILWSLYFYPFAFIFCKKQKIGFGSDLFEVFRTKGSPFILGEDDWDDKADNWPANIDKGNVVILSATMNDSKYKIKFKPKRK